MIKTLCLLFGALAPLQADFIDYRFVSAVNTQTSVFNAGGVTVTGGPGLVYVNVSNGLSVVGGGNDYSVNVGEFLDFAFNAGVAFGVNFHVNSDLSSTVSLQAFGTGGSLGTVSANVASNFTDVSSLFGNQQITHFSVTTTGGLGYRLDTLLFTPVPEPSTLAFLLPALAALGIFRRHARARSSSSR